MWNIHLEFSVADWRRYRKFYWGYEYNALEFNWFIFRPNQKNEAASNLSTHGILFAKFVWFTFNVQEGSFKHTKIYS